MTVRWWLRCLTVGGIWLVLVTALALMDMRPAVVALAAASAAVGAVLYLVLDVGDVAAPVDWRATSDGGSSARGADVRVAMLRRQIADGRHLDGNASLHRVLVGLVDDALAVQHRIDRVADPVRARVVLGDDLARFVDGSNATDVLADPRRFAALLDRIERLAAPTGPTSRAPALPGTSRSLDLQEPA